MYAYVDCILRTLNMEGHGILVKEYGLTLSMPNSHLHGFMV